MVHAEDKPGAHCLHREVAEHVFHQLPPVLFVSCLLGALVALVLCLRFPCERVLLWLSAIYTLSLLRFLVYFRFRRVKDGEYDPLRWLRLYSWGTVLIGAAWATTPLLFYSPTSPQTNVFVAFVLGGIIAAAATSMAPLSRTMKLFTAIICTPMAILFALEGGLLYLVMSAMLLIYGIAYVIMSARAGHTILESLQLRHKNVREIEERRKAKTDLQRAHDNLELAVAKRSAELRASNAKLWQQINERISAEEQLAQSEARYRTLVESSRDWIWEVDSSGRYTYSSPSVEGILGYSPEEMLGKTYYDVMPEDEEERIREFFGEKRGRAQPFSGLINRCLHKDGSERILETNGEPVLNGFGEVVGYRGIDRDVTNRLKRDEEAKKLDHLESLGLLAGGIAHDFNNILTAVFGNVDLARMEIPETSSAGQALADSMGAIEQARHLTGQLLTFSQGGSPRISAHSIRDLLEKVCDVTVDGTSIKCDLALPEELWQAKIDQGQIWQVLVSILSNSKEAMPNGGNIRVEAENITVGQASVHSLAPGKYIQIQIHDNGAGISHSDLTKVFDPYFTSKDRGVNRGTGIGLSICESIMEKHRGQITLDSKRGVGTTVTLLLPAHEETPATAEATPEVPPCRILLLEDDHAVSKTGIRLLERLGHTVSAAAEGKTAIRLFKEACESGQQFDAAILDLSVPGGMGGKDVITAIRLIDPKVPAAVVSGYADDPVMTDFEKYGFNTSLCKPFNASTLAHTISTLIASAST
jgi:PAS domain S-box-containing protein